MSKATQVWSTEMTTTLIARYNGDNSELEAIAKEFKKTVPMIRSKLVSMKVYVKPTTVRAVGGASSVRKSHLVSNIETILSVPKGSLPSFEKATKQELEALTQALISYSDHFETE